MAEESALKPRHLPSHRIDHHHTGGLPRAEHLHKSPPSGDDPENTLPGGLSQDTEINQLEWAYNVLENTPSTRSDLVRSLQIQIEAGLYSIDMELLAERLVGHVCRPLVIQVK